jgi:SRSO17 transposase
VKSLVDPVVAASASVEDIEAVVGSWTAVFDDVFAAVVAPAFVRREPRLRARSFLLALASGLGRKNGWTVAEFAGESAPDGMQRLLNAAVWDADAVRDRLQLYLAGHLGDRSAVLVVDETGFAKKGVHSVGVQRQYSGTLGRVDNCQIGVFVAYVTGGGRLLVDRELYLPESWTADRDRCRGAGVGDDVQFATKPELARRMLARTLPRLPAPWVAGDETYGRDPTLRGWLEDHSVGYVLTVGCDQRVSTAAGRVRADDLAAGLPPSAWQRISCGPGSKGDRFYDWAWVELPATGDGQRSLLVRRSIRDGDRAYYLCWSPRPVPLAELVRVAGARWGVEECFQTGKTGTGLDDYQVRRYHAWYRHVTLSMVAHAWLAVTAGGSLPDADDGLDPTVAEPAGNRQTAKRGTRRLWTAPRAARNESGDSPCSQTRVL